MHCKSLLVVAAFAALPGIAHATTGFTGAYGPGSATISTANGGSIDTSAAPASITLYGGSDGVAASDQLYGFTLAQAGTLSFDWNFTQNDCCGPSYDPFGYQVNGVFTQLTDDVGPDSQSGSVSLLLLAGDQFAFDQYSTDSVSGFATTVVSNFVAPGGSAVPEPASWAMMIGGLGIAGASMRLRARKVTVAVA